MSTEEMGKKTETEAPEEGKEEQLEKNTIEPEVLPPEDTPEEASDDTAEDNPEVLKLQLQEQVAKTEECCDRLLRLQADFENFRRRTRQEKAGLGKYATEQLIINLLQVLDNFERALETGNKGDVQASFWEGMEMVYRQLQDVLAKEGLAVIPAVGEQFDPNKHDAVMQEENTDWPDNTVSEELRRGYLLKDKVIRPAMVKVAKGV